ncbi:MAG: hypothetical protein CMJ29_13170 [Phycisphaerae bacterium]|nr:hypothetical protein [Phycisphaerae bacterium]|tara:strand:+ start:331 stop:801 length:471 start_codon:yes stop_codon:yes gene_type:complete
MNSSALHACFRRLGIGILLVGMACLSGCASSAPKTSLPIILVDQGSNGAEVRLVPGQELEVQLIVNIEQDIRWVLVGQLDETILMPLGQRLFQARDADERPLTRPIEELRFKAVGNGELILDLAYVPVGGTLADSMNRFFLKIIVDEFRGSSRFNR